jgi:transcriptional regulator with XRE-family HTH domain
MAKIVKQRQALADFLKTRRARLRPEQFALPFFSGRRAPGLRREEVALLIGVGVSWYTWLEQGRDIHVSDQVLERLALILQLNKEEHCHLFALAHGPASSSRPSQSETRSRRGDLSSPYQTILDGLDYPAQLFDRRRMNVVAWNESSSRVFGDYAGRSERERNVAWATFMNPALRTFIGNWEQGARKSIALLRARVDQYPDDEWLTELVADLQQASPEFRAWWPQHDILLTCKGVNELNHPLVGPLSLQSTTLALPEQPDLLMTIYTPLPQSETVARLEALTADVARL